MATISKLWKRINFSDYDSIFEMSFDREIMQSERTRALVVFIICCLIILWFMTIPFFFSKYYHESLFKVYSGYKIFTWFAIIFGAMAVYELCYAIALMVFLKKKKLFPFFPRFGNAIIEISIPSVVMLFAYKSFNSIEVLYTPVFLIYFVFISLSSLRLNFTLSLFTGIVAGIEYIALSSYIIHRIKFDEAYSFLYSPGMHILKGLLLALVGLVNGLVAQQIKKRMKRSLKTTEEKNRIIGIFGQHVSPAVVNKLLNYKDDLGSETRRVCIMFLDIRGFTKFAENRQPEDVVNYLNTLFGFMIDIINENKGIINKFLGDGFMAVFGAPFSDGQESQNAVKAAREILSRLEEEVSSGRIPQTRIGIGMHVGQAVTGNVGSSQRKEYTIIGDVVNIASRIEHLNKKYDSQILVSEEVWRTTEKSAYETHDIGTVDIRGHAGVHIYKIA